MAATATNRMMYGAFTRPFAFSSPDAIVSASLPIAWFGSGCDMYPGIVTSTVLLTTSSSDCWMSNKNSAFPPSDAKASTTSLLRLSARGSPTLTVWTEYPKNSYDTATVDEVTSLSLLESTPRTTLTQSPRTLLSKRDMRYSDVIVISSPSWSGPNKACRSRRRAVSPVSTRKSRLNGASAIASVTSSNSSGGSNWKVGVVGKGVSTSGAVGSRVGNEVEGGGDGELDGSTVGLVVGVPVVGAGLG
mmetsp:Transcript_11034/g.25086  ORF Transcript_11034/g.25086 Transcript_11034/m.25086 type:complete len:246 (-) Transcript_11034:30-767(-)